MAIAKLNARAMHGLVLNFLFMPQGPWKKLDIVPNMKREIGMVAYVIFCQGNDGDVLYVWATP
jgi:hypothetical protein